MLRVHVDQGGRCEDVTAKSHLDDVGVDLGTFSVRRRVAWQRGAGFEEGGESVVVREVRGRRSEEVPVENDGLPESAVAGEGAEEGAADEGVVFGAGVEEAAGVAEEELRGEGGGEGGEVGEGGDEAGEEGEVGVDGATAEEGSVYLKEGGGGKGRALLQKVDAPPFVVGPEPALTTESHAGAALLSLPCVTSKDNNNHAR